MMPKIHKCADCKLILEVTKIYYCPCSKKEYCPSCLIKHKCKLK